MSSTGSATSWHGSHIAALNSQLASVKSLDFVFELNNDFVFPVLSAFAKLTTTAKVALGATGTYLAVNGTFAAVYEALTLAFTGASTILIVPFKVSAGVSGAGGAGAFLAAISMMLLLFALLVPLIDDFIRSGEFYDLTEKQQEQLTVIQQKLHLAWIKLKKQVPAFHEAVDEYNAANAAAGAAPKPEAAKQNVNARMQKRNEELQAQIAEANGLVKDLGNIALENPSGTPEEIEKQQKAQIALSKAVSQAAKETGELLEKVEQTEPVAPTPPEEVKKEVANLLGNDQAAAAGATTAAAQGLQKRKPRKKRGGARFRKNRTKRKSFRRKMNRKSRR
jgi:pyruvate/2-oxoglutarate dehydrogenase complex dihydrolipoamide acyltransferase (E2) component